ncbi:protein SODIUM POTASSIUM ROOT DEFECTIVE 2-like [Tasmannia lanceolata]|uniref:protein SODIUM POTASSIUM ROOT DEFECTIVE 2-like n=1 Tax=Tasmannia lanceolata TaxID=3420 RepID=UPI00406497E8
MKGIDLFCTSQASTAICVSMDHKSMVRHGNRALDRQTPRLIDRRRTKAPHPCSQSPSKPKSTRKSSAKQTDLISPPGSSRYLLTDTPFFDVLSDFDPISALVPAEAPVRSRSVKAVESSGWSRSIIPAEPTRSRSLKADESTFRSRPMRAGQSAILKPSLRSHEQVVVLKVSLHCKGCEGKVRKHISRMEGVTSFNIDFSTKKVTVIGDVTPLGVLTSISKVKKAEFWPPSSPSSSSSSLSSIS